MEPIRVIGAGLAGCEAAWQIAKAGVPVILHEMKPQKYTPAHHYGGFAELVCSNSLRSLQLNNAVGLLKEELRRLGSLIMEAADATAVPAGAALAVDRYRFSDYITEKITSHPLITMEKGEVTMLPDDGITVVASGPLTSDALASHIREKLGEGYLSFFDAAAPIVDAATIDMEKAYFASRYGKGEASYINCPMEKDEYLAFLAELLGARTAELHEFDSEAQKKPNVFEGCMPVEVMASRGEDTLRYGPLKPVGLPDPKTGKEYYAVVQLRRDDKNGTMYNMVGFQTHLAIPEQKRVFRMIPGLENAEFYRYGVMHRNTYLNSPGLLDSRYKVLDGRKLWFAGQMTGVEGYIESAASGMVTGINAAFDARGMVAPDLTEKTAIGALGYYVSRGSNGRFDPMNVNFGIIAPLDKRVKGGKKAKNEALAARALEIVDEIAAELASKA